MWFLTTLADGLFNPSGSQKNTLKEGPKEKPTKFAPPPPPHPRVEAPTDGLRFHSGVFKHGNKSDNPNGGCSGFTLEGGVRESLQNALGSKSWCHLLHKTKPPLPRRTAEVPEQCGQGRGGGRGFRRGTKKKNASTEVERLEGEDVCSLCSQIKKSCKNHGETFGKTFRF